MTQSAANAEMGRYWNEVAGPRWVGRQAVQEARNAEVLALLLAACKAVPGERVLDVGCGPGATTLPLAQAVGSTGHVTGADISQPMLAAARKRIEEAGVANVSLVLADAQVHPFEPASFDLVTSRFGVMFFADPTAAFRNLHRALRPSGRLCMAVWAPIADNMHWKIPYEITIARIGPPASRDPHAPGPFAFADRDYLNGILTAAGFAGSAITPTRFHLFGPSAAALAEHVGLFGEVQRLMDEKQADAATREAIVKDTEAAFAAYATADGVRLPGTFYLVTARAE
ncbi:MAG TPA: methyltransferase domain-containing protein [Stellaceae bacterium]|nr:methyltransferase domain-containing protein [Stellaceae bacterium]